MMRARERFALGVLATLAVGGRLAAAQTFDRRQLDRIERALQQEAQAVVELADASDDPDPTDFFLTWRNDFFKAQAGTFVPFVVTIDTKSRKPPRVFLYVRVARRVPGDVGQRRGRRGTDSGDSTPHPFEEIYPVDLAGDRGQPTRIARGFAIEPGEYDLTVVVRERERREDRGRRRMAGVLRRELNVPDYSTPELTTSTIVLADELTMLDQAPPPGELTEHPYVIGLRDIQPAVDAVFRRTEELIVIFLVYNPSVRADEHFDLEVEYHFFRKASQGAGVPARPSGDRAAPAAQPGETYVNRTEPQRFNPQVLGTRFDPSAGQPVMAGQGVPLAGFQEGEYRLTITVTDLVSGQSIERQVLFTVGS
ncbi:MAG: hypothetical protein ACRD15_19310 [Vicinamibacterales bacterium]